MHSHQSLSGLVHQADQLPSNVSQRPSQAAPTLSMLLESKHKETTLRMPPLARIDTQNTIGHLIHQSKIVNANDEASIKTEQIATADLNNAESPIKDEDQQLMEVFSGLIPDDIDELADINLDDLIDVEPVAASASADNLETQDNLDLKTFQSPPPTPAISEPQQVIKEEPININENACDAPPTIEPKLETFTKAILQAQYTIFKQQIY